MAAPTFSAIVPTHDRPGSLRLAVQSVLDQTGAPAEVIVIDDGSLRPADTVLVANERVRILRNHSAQGPAAARERGAQAARGTYLAFLDDDDVWLPGKLSKVLTCFEQHPQAGAVFHLVRAPGSPGTGRGTITLHERPLLRFLRAQPSHLDGVAVRRDIHLQVGFDPTYRAAEDLDYLLRLAQVTMFVELDEVLAEHGPRAARTSAISLETRVQHRLRLRAQHDHLFDRKADAFHLMRLGHLYRRSGDAPRAAWSFARACERQPSLGEAWRGLVLSALPVAAAERLIRRRSR